MEELSKKSEIVQAINNVELLPSVIERKEVSNRNYTKLPLAKLSTLGVAFEQLIPALQNSILSNSDAGGTDILLKATLPPGGRLAAFSDGSGLLGTVLNENNQIMGQARLTPVMGKSKLNPIALNPAMILMAATLMSIDKKLDSIQEIQKEIIEFLEQKEKAKIRGNHNPRQRI